MRDEEELNKLVEEASSNMAQVQASERVRLLSILEARLKVEEILRLDRIVSELRRIRRGKK